MRNLEVQILRNDEPLESTAMCHEIIKADSVAQFAQQLICMILGSHRGGFSNRPDPVDVATYASQVAHAAYVEFAKREWVIDVPSLDQLKGDGRKTVGFK